MTSPDRDSHIPAKGDGGTNDGVVRSRAQAFRGMTAADLESPGGAAASMALAAARAVVVLART